MGERRELAAILGRANRPNLGSTARAIEDDSWLWAADAVLKAGYLSPLGLHRALDEAHVAGEKSAIIAMREMSDLLLAKYERTATEEAAHE